MLRRSDPDPITPRDVFAWLIAPLLIGVGIEVAKGVVEHVRKQYEPKPDPKPEAK